MKHKKKIFLMAFIIWINTFFVIYGAEPPNLNATMAILTEMETGKILYEKNADIRAYPASMTKILTALIFAEYFDEDEIIVTGSEINSVPGDSSKAGHKQGESITALNLMRALMLRSGNETGNVMAAATARKINGADMPFEQAEKYFVGLMNEKARELGAKNTNFNNAHGYHDDGHYTTARDMALICAAAMENTFVAKVSAEVSYAGNSAGDFADETMTTQEYDWRTTNSLLTKGANYYDGATGIKTGFTDSAGYCFAGSAERDGVTLISIVFNDGEEDRWLDTIKLLDFGFDNHKFEYLQRQGDILDNIELFDPPIGEINNMDIYTDKEFRDYFSIDQFESITREIIYDEEKITRPEISREGEGNNEILAQLLLPVKKGEIVGRVRYVSNDEVLFEANILASGECEARSYKTDIDYYYNLFLDNAFTFKALPGWIFIFSVIILFVFLIIEIVKRRRKKDFYTLKKRY